MAYQPIENYGIIGNMHTAALVSMDGSIDWFCFPRFDSPSVFAAILDDQKGGRFRIAPKAEHITSRQMYWPDTNVLVTYFLARGEAGEITDFMPMDVTGTGTRRDRLVRRVRALRGSMTFRIQCRPGFNYARARHETEIIDQGACFHTPGSALRSQNGKRPSCWTGRCFIGVSGSRSVLTAVAGARWSTARPCCSNCCVTNLPAR